MFKANKPTKVVYQKLVNKKRKVPLRSQKKWSINYMCEHNECVDLEAVYQKPFQCTKLSKRLEFEFKIFHRRLATNCFLKKKKTLIDNDLCSFCQKEEETLIHLFWSCTVTSIFWQEFKNGLLKEEPTLTFDLSPSLVLGLRPQVLKRKHYYFLLIVARFHIWTSRTNSQCPGTGFPSFLSPLVP